MKNQVGKIYLRNIETNIISYRNKKYVTSLTDCININQCFMLFQAKMKVLPNVSCRNKIMMKCIGYLFIIQFIAQLLMMLRYNKVFHLLVL